MALRRKILTLPGIDHSGKEIFETPDVDNSKPAVQKEIFTSSDIEVTTFDRKAAVANFIGKGFQLYEAQGEGPEDNDLPAAAVGRVQGTLNSLTEELQAVLQKVRSERESQPPLVHSPPEPFVNRPRPAETLHLLAVEQRLASLEKLVGADNCSLTSSLQETMSKLETHVGLLDANALDELNRKVRLLEREMDKAISKKQVHAHVSGLDQRRRIEDMYDILQRCDAVAPQVPILLNRMLTLKLLHDDAITFRDSLSTAAAAGAHIDELLKEGQTLLEDVEGGLKQSIATIERNMSQMDARMSQLALQYQTLSPS